MNTTEQQIAGLRRNIARDEAELADMGRRCMDSDGCCPGCMFGDAWRTAYDRLERRVSWLHIIEAKLQRARYPYSPLRRPYFSWEL